MSHPLLLETVWTDKPRADDAERLYQESLIGGQNAKAIVSTTQSVPTTTQAKVSATIVSTPSSTNLDSRVDKLESENKDLKNVVEELKKSLSKLENRLSSLESNSSAKSSISKPIENGIPAKAKPTEASKPTKDEDDDDVDLFGSDEEEDEEATKLREKRLAEYAVKKSKKTAVIAKSSVVLDVKPWDDETDMSELEKQVRTIQMDGLVWGASKLVPLAFGIKKLQIVTVVEDEKVSIEDLQERIEAFEDLVQSVDIAAFSKI